jgi:DNA-binding Lrp family transcriptional regulator
MSKMDDTDRELIALLRADARLPVATLAKHLKVARGTVQNRLRRLEQEGIIVGYTLRLRPQTDRPGVRGMMCVASDGNRATEALNALRGNPNVVSLHMTNGRWDIIAELRSESLEDFERVLRDIRRLASIKDTETSIFLSTHKL